MEPSNSSSTNTLKIRRLDSSVVNRIAAGEVIQRPVNAIKEMLENSIDAVSTNIQISVKEGGLKLIQIQDNGTGIHKEDLNLVCERFATSKLQEFEDLQKIATFGFRGEALASISHIAHVTVKTKTKDNPCAYQVSYCDGIPKGSPKPCAGNQGTLILVEDLYYSMPIRRRAFQNYSNEYSKILDVVSKYAVHYPTIGFSVKKHGENVSDVKTSPNSTILDNIKFLFGVDKAKELLEVNLKDDSLRFTMNGYISSVNFSSKKHIFILFINNRLVESSALRKAIEAVYASYLPKHNFPFIYMSIKITPENVDVNVHPTKQEVHFLNESSIIEAVQKVIEERLLNCTSSKTLLIQTVLPCLGEADVGVKDENTTKKVYAYNMVRMDSKEQKLDAFIQKLQPLDSSSEQHDNTCSVQSSASFQIKPTTSKCLDGLTLTNVPFKRDIQLTSVVNLRQKINDGCDKDLVKCFSNYTFVGCVDRQFSLIQNETKLLLLNLTKLSEEFFYQVMLRDFGNFSCLQLSEPAPITELITLVLKYDNIEWDDCNGPKEEFPDLVAKFFIKQSPMLKDYFSMEIDKEGNLIEIPYLLAHYYPALNNLPILMYRLYNMVNWEDEQECFDSFCKQMASFYRFSENEPFNFENPNTEEDDKNETDPSEAMYKRTVEQILLPAFRKVYLPKKENLKNGLILQIANLPDLYKVFERC